MLMVKGAVSYLSTKYAKGLILEGVQMFGRLDISEQEKVKLLVV